MGHFCQVSLILVLAYVRTHKNYSCLDKEKNTNGTKNRKIWNLICFGESSAVKDFDLQVCFARISV